ncbi:type II toxin-antitoxin system RelB family antitoxin [Pseudomonas orientalis]|uniref:type II toxin-antitoxin system RelB family antitoxin n=1 Tax=Pseudomonas orientalis TaxID=76758 RepID=UPI000F05FB3E
METEFSDIPQSMEDELSYDQWFRARVQEALNDPRPGIPHERVMYEMNALIESKLSSYQSD